MSLICNNTFRIRGSSYYIASNGRSPFIEWLKGLKNSADRARINAKIERLMCGLFNDTKSVGGGVEELRLHFGSGYRIYYGRLKNEIIVFLCGGSKGSQKRDIERAKKYWSDYLEG